MGAIASRATDGPERRGKSAVKQGALATNGAKKSVGFKGATTEASGAAEALVAALATFPDTDTSDNAKGRDTPQSTKDAVVSASKGDTIVQITNTLSLEADSDAKLSVSTSMKTPNGFNQIMRRSSPESKAREETSTNFRGSESDGKIGFSPCEKSSKASRQGNSSRTSQKPYFPPEQTSSVGKPPQQISSRKQYSIVERAGRKHLNIETVVTSKKSGGVTGTNNERTESGSRET